MYNLESDEFISINNQDHYLNNNNLHILEKFKLKFYIDNNNNEEKGKIEMDNISINNDQEIEIKSIENLIIIILCDSPYLYPNHIIIIIIIYS